MPANFRAAARERFRDSEVLFAQQRWTSAVYMARFGLECVLKDLLLQKLKRTDLPEQWYIHDLWKLLKGFHNRPVPRSIATSLAEINAVDINIRYNQEELDQETAARIAAKIRGLCRWLTEL